MSAKRSRPEGRLNTDSLPSLEGQSSGTGNKINVQSYRTERDSSTVCYRRTAKAPAAKVGIPAPAAKRNRRESNQPLGQTYGNRICMGWQFDEDRYAIQTRSYKMAKHLRRLKDNILFADALEGPYMQTWLLPCRSESKGRSMVDCLLKTFGAECGDQDKAHFYREDGSKSPQNVSVEKIGTQPGVSPQRNAGATEGGSDDYPAWDWTYFEDKLDAFGTEFCTLYPRFDGQWAVQLKDPRLIPCFSKRARTRRSGYSVEGYGQLRQYIFPCKNKAWARKVFLTAVSTLPEYEANKLKLKGAMK
jgi:hypothetical protein